MSAEPNNAATPSSPKARRPRRLRRRLVGLAIGLVVGLLLAEITLRVCGYSPAFVNPLRSFHQADPVLVYRGRPDVEGRFRRSQFDVVVRHDEDGFRAAEFERPTAEVDRTIHVFGDSFTWGWGVENGEVFTDHLRRLLPDVAVRNYGINGCGTALQTKLLETEVAADVRPGDVVVLMFFYNDFFDNTQEKRLHGRVEGDEVVEVTPDGAFGSEFERWFKAHSYLVNFAAHVWDFQKARRGAVEQRAAGETRGAGPSAEARRITAHFLRRFAALVAARDARFELVWVADSRDVDSRARDEGSVYFDAFRATAAAADLEPLDPTAALVAARQAEAAEPLYFDGDEHWTPRGHEVIAAFLAAQLGS